jgi:hypothetical protein
VQLCRNHNANDDLCHADNINESLACPINTTLCIIIWVSQLSDTNNIFELKEQAKWSKNPEEKKTAIRELSAQGDRALSALGEIMSVTAYDDVKAACMEAIKAIEGKGAGAASSQDQKKEDKSGAGAKLADLPP